MERSDAQLYTVNNANRMTRIYAAAREEIWNQIPSSKPVPRSFGKAEEGASAVRGMIYECKIFAVIYSYSCQEGGP